MIMSHPGHLALWLALLAPAGLLAATASDQAGALYRAKHYDAARRAYEKVFAADPHNALAAYRLGRIALLRDDRPAAVRWLEEATALAPRQARYFQSLGDAYGLSAEHAGLFSKLGWAHKCADAYRRAVAMDPSNVDFHLSLFNFYLQAPSIAGGGLPRARTEAAAIQRLNDVRGTLALVTVDAIERKYDDAFTALRGLRRDHPDATAVLYQLGRMAALSGRHLVEGAAALTTFIARPHRADAPPLWAAHWRLGQIREHEGKPAAARAEYAVALKLNPTQPQVVEAMKRLK